MGNGTSQSVVLGSPRFQAAYSPRNNGYGGVPKYVHPQNMVLPKPVAGQRLRTTDNGSILQAAGTIRGGRRDEPDAKRRSDMTEKENDCYHHLNLRNHRMFHSDPNISRRPADPEPAEMYSNRRSCAGGVAVRTSKIKYKKKARAPEPPPPSSGNSLPRQLERRSYGDSGGEGISKKNMGGCKCIVKPKAPQPPPIVVHPPPPPPLPITRSCTSNSSKSQSELSSVTRNVTATKENRMGYEKNVHPLEKWRNCRSTGDVRLMGGPEEESSSRTTVFDSRNKISSAAPPSHLPPAGPDPFQKEIQAVTQKIALQNGHKQLPDSPASPPKQKEDPPKFYFSDVGIFKTAHQESNNNHQQQSTRRSPVQTEVVRTDEIVPSLQRFSPGRRRYKSPSSTPTRQQDKDWDSLAARLPPRAALETDIDLRLRTVLPRKPKEVPNFSASEAWQALPSDGSSQHSTSEDSKTHSKHRSFVDSQWTPRQDLLDDSDVSSEGEGVVLPRMHQDVSPRFSLPTVMFSNMRPIGSDIKTNSGQLRQRPRFEPSLKEKASKQVASSELTSLAPSFKRFLSKRNKFTSEEDIAHSDSNWTFGQHGLQKRGKQYCSDLMLSEKKKHELMAKNSHLSDFLGDILLSKADDVRKQMKSSDSSHSNFSFYSTEGQIAFRPEKGGFVKEECDALPVVRGKVRDMRRRFDGGDLTPPQKANYRNTRKKCSQSGIEMGRRRDLELAKMLEDEVRRRRNKEKISIRQQLQRMKQQGLQSDDDEEEDFDDEAYFTEPKSREDSQSPFFASSELMSSELGIRPLRPQLSHWQSSPALLENSVLKVGAFHKSRLSVSSVVSSPDPDVWTQSRAVDSWLTQMKRRPDSSPPRPPRILDMPRAGMLAAPDPANDGDVSSSPTPAPAKKERRKTNIYKQLMDIVRKEERQLKKAQRNVGDSSHRESSPSTCSSESSSYSYSDTSSSGNHPQGGVSASREFHSSGYRAPSFQVAFVKPYSPNKMYRPVPFHSPYRMPGVQEETKVS